ncbi:hypothetical protein B0I35DRAFT_440587 [Stachybotrys elegans]|uniref:Uncharacterized protein n=1 Tax=Stachybotrys elegans TaxID=80388 RepID=A0A8K0WMN4_9HYPO|nr:hypothetical protein B0I35DRAFT_440587 [Stachybotrys elegans]
MDKMADGSTIASMAMLDTPMERHGVAKLLPYGGRCGPKSPSSFSSRIRDPANCDGEMSRKNPGLCRSLGD